MNLDDLQPDKEIIPFFDMSLNQYSREALRALFYEYPADKEEAEERQQIISGLIVRLPTIKNLYSYKSDIIECYHFCRNFQPDQAARFRNATVFKIGLWFDRKRVNQISSKFLQLLLLMDRIYNNYFQHLKIVDFPVSFSGRITAMTALLNTFRGLVKQEEWAGLGSLSGKLTFQGFKKMATSIGNKEFDSFWNDFFLFEAYLSIATIARDNNLSIPKFVQSGIKLSEFYHPLLKKPVKNSIDLKHNVVLLTGPNMSGKSTLLKSISLCVYLGRIGLPIPASTAELVFIDDINVFISSKDDLQHGYSHFMLEVQNLKSVVLSARDHRVFAVFDEMFSGTNSEDAINILRIAVNGVAQFSQSYFLISTHYRIKDLGLTENESIDFMYIASGINNGIPQFTYEVKSGSSDLRLGLILFENAGLLQLLEKGTST